MKMRNVLVIALGLASLCAVGGGQSAFAGWTKRQVCQWRLSGAYVGNFETGPLGVGVKVCREIDVLVPNDSKGGGRFEQNLQPLNKVKKQISDHA
jgi:hypothetical protein